MAFHRQKQFAFITTAASLFCFLCFFSSAFLKDFETTSYVDISASSQQPEMLFEEAIGKEISDEKLVGHIAASLTQSNYGEDFDVAHVDLENVRESLNFRISPNKTGQQFRLSAAYSGNGSQPEQALTKNIVHAVAHRLSGIDRMANAMQTFNSKCELVQSNIEIKAQKLHEELGHTHNLVNYLNADLSDIHEVVESIRPEASFGNPNSLAQEGFDREQVAGLLNSLQEKLDELSVSSQEETARIGQSIATINDQLRALNVSTTGETQQSIRIINASLPEGNAAIRSILEMLNNVDTDSIQTRIGQIQNHLKVDAVQLREDVSELRNLTNQFSESRFVVNGISEPRTRPAGRFPNIGHVFLLGLVSLIGGAFVATYYRPENANQGFDTEDAVKNTLGLPVVSKLVSAIEKEDRPKPWGNSVVGFFEVALFGFVLLVAILCLIQPEIRAAFFESPFYGMSKIANLFF